MLKLKWLTILSVLMSLAAHGQYRISGKVLDAQSNPLPGANIMVGSEGTTSDNDGNYSLDGLEKGSYTVAVSYVGYQDYERDVLVDEDVKLDIQLSESVIKGEEVFVYATRAQEKTPTTFSNISNKEIEDRNLGQDIPFVLRYTPSMVVTSDAGNGVGYTGIRIRGSDPTRINVTVNGIPLNDSESHGVFWVNMPDFSSSVNNIQIQRGVGTSTNGAAAFGATVNLQTSLPSRESFAKISNSFGSFNTWRHTVEVNTGLINDRFSFEGRLSKIASDGYIDRASSDLKSYYLAGGYYGKKTTIKALTFAGNEVTYQSWNGTPEARLLNDVEGMQEVIANNGYTPEQAENLLTSGRTFNYYLYDNEVDNYSQDHYQLHVSHTFNTQWNINGALHYTYGRGYFEQYRVDDDFSDYNLPDVTIGDSTITSTDLIRRRWLDNHFYGVTFSTNYSADNLDFTFGGAWNTYDGDHFGELIWMQYASTSNIRDRYYDNVGLKDDFNLFAKANYSINDRLSIYGDLQVRSVSYETEGIDNDLRPIDTGGDYVFFNPKLGATYQLGFNEQLYASFAVGNREPVRNDFIDAPNGETPEHETLRNLEIGYRKSGKNFDLNVNYYLMDYENQLVLTGALNDVGSSIRVNVPDSYRTGIEIAGAYAFSKQWQVAGNLTLSRNKIANFTEVIYDYGTNFDEFNIIENEYNDTNIAFSPEIIAGGQLSYKPVTSLNITWLSKYVGKQYLDNTSNDDRSIDPYFVNDLQVLWSPQLKSLKDVTFNLMINNVLNEEYSSNGYTFGYAGGDYVVRENYYYPQAGTHFLLGLTVKL